MTTFLIQNYAPKTSQVQYDSPLLLSRTDSSQADDVRSILARFAITGIANGRDPSRDSYIGQMSDDVPVDDKRIDEMLDFPDLSYLDEMEMKDYIHDNIQFTEEEEPDPPAVNQAQSPPDPSPATQVDPGQQQTS